MRAGLLVACVASCGGIAVVDGGSGGSDGSPTSSVTSTAASGGSQSLRCPAACERLLDCLPPLDDCVESCRAAAGNCATEHDAWLNCVLFEHQSGCMFPPLSMCDGVLQAFVGCRFGTLGPADCMIGADGCTCTESAGAQDFQSTCYPGTGGLACDCSFGPRYVATCEQQSEECLPRLNCCSALLFVIGP